MAKAKKDTQAAAQTAGDTAGQSTAETGQATAAAPVKKTKTAAPIIPLTPAQEAAQAALAKANQDAQDELKKNAGPALEAVAKAVADAKEALKVALKAQKDLNDQLGIVPTKKTGNGVGVAKVGKFYFLKSFAEGKGAPQARQILAIIETGGENGISRDDVIKGMEGVVKTTMPLPRLLSYYTKPLSDEGYIRTEVPVAAEVPAPTAA